MARPCAGKHDGSRCLVKLQDEMTSDDDSARCRSGGWNRRGEGGSWRIIWGSLPHQLEDMGKRGTTTTTTATARS